MTSSLRLELMVAYYLDVPSLLKPTVKLKGVSNVSPDILNILIEGNCGSKSNVSLATTGYMHGTRYTKEMFWSAGRMSGPPVFLRSFMCFWCATTSSSVLILSQLGIWSTFDFTRWLNPKTLTTKPLCQPTWCKENFLCIKVIKTDRHLLTLSLTLTDTHPHIDRGVRARTHTHTYTHTNTLRLANDLSIYCAFSTNTTQCWFEKKQKQTEHRGNFHIIFFLIPCPFHPVFWGW